MCFCIPEKVEREGNLSCLRVPNILLLKRRNQSKKGGSWRVRRVKNIRQQKQAALFVSHLRYPLFFFFRNPYRNVSPPSVFLSCHRITVHKTSCLFWPGAVLYHILFINTCQKLSEQHQCSRQPAELTKAGINICVEFPDEDGHDRGTQGDKITEQ